MSSTIELPRLGLPTPTAGTPTHYQEDRFDYAQVTGTATPVQERVHVPRLTVDEALKPEQHPTGSERVLSFLTRLGVPDSWLGMSAGWTLFTVQEMRTPTQPISIMRPFAPRRPVPTTRDLATRSVAELRIWLGLGWDDLSQITGVSRNTLINYHHGRALPHAEPLQRVLRVHALVRGVVERVGTNAAVRWLNEGQPSVFQLMVEGEIEQATGRVQKLLVDRSVVYYHSPSVAIDMPLAVPDFPVDAQPPQRVRRPRRR